MTEIPVSSIFPPSSPPASPPDPGDWHGMFSGLHAHLGKIAGALPDPRAQRRAEGENVWAIDIDPVPIPLVAGFGILDLPQLLGPGLGEHWDVHVVSCTGHTAGTVLGWVNLPGPAVQVATPAAQQAALRVIFSSAGVNNYGKNQVHLRPQDRLTFVASGIVVPAGGQVLVSLGATRVAEPYWGRYLI